VHRPRKRPQPLRWLRDEVPPLVDRIDRRALLIGAGVLAAGVLAWALISGPLSGDEDLTQTKVVTVSVESDNPAEAPVGPLGFPLVATRNTTRVGGPDPASDAAAVALATHPPTPNAPPIEAAIVVGEGDWQAGLAASVLTGPPLRLPLLVGTAGGLSDTTAQALAQLDPRGGSGPADVAVYSVGDVPPPPGRKTESLPGDSPAALAGAVDELRQKLLKQEPSHIVVASQDDPDFAMPAAAWAARSGDPVLFSGRDKVPGETLAALRRHRGVPVYVLGGETVISQEAVRELQRVSPGVQRVGADEPVANAIEFAGYANGTFGWNISDPGHGLVLANGSRPLDAAAGAALSASGEWGPLLVIDRAGDLPAEMRSFLLDIKPGFEDDPTRAVYNHVWLIGDTSAIGATVQAEVDDLAELTEIGPGAGGPVIESGQTSSASPGRAEGEPSPAPKGKP
jgi:hypothetical protein